MPIGFMIHSMVGMMLIPLLAIVLLIVSFFAKIPGGVKWAGFVSSAVLFQWVLAHLRPRDPGLGFLHGLNALLCSPGSAWRAAKQATVVGDAAPRR